MFSFFYWSFKFNLYFQMALKNIEKKRIAIQVKYMVFIKHTNLPQGASQSVQYMTPFILGFSTWITPQKNMYSGIDGVSHISVRQNMPMHLKYAYGSVVYFTISQRNLFTPLYPLL